MEDIAELIITLMFAPFESKIDDLFLRIKGIPNKALRISLIILVSLLFLAIIIAIFVGLIFLIDLIHDFLIQ